MARPKTRYTPEPKSEALEIGERLKWIRKQRGWSQAEFGEVLGLSQRAISDYECGRNRLPAPVLLKITERLKVPLKAFTDHTQEGPNTLRVEPIPNRHIFRRIQLIEQLPRQDQKMILRVIDNAVAAIRNNHDAM